MITIGLTIIGCVLLFAPIHWAHVDSKRRMQRDHDAEVRDLRAQVMYWETRHDTVVETSRRIAADLHQQVSRALPPQPVTDIEWARIKKAVGL